MELPQPRPFGTGGRKSTHDFLSLYSPVPDPTPSQVGYLKTHDFLQPLEGSGKNNTKEENTVEIMSSAEPPPPASPPSGKYVLPGGIGTYSISHISYFNQRVLKPEGGIVTVAQASNTDLNDQENSNGSSYTGSGFTLWEESAVKKGKTGKENVAGDRHGTREAGVNTGVGGPWMTSEHPSQSSSNNTTTTTATTTAAAATTTTTTTNKHRNAIPAFSSRSSPQPPLSQKNQTFMDMLKSAKIAHNDDDDDEEEFILKKEPSPHLRTDLTVKAGGGAGKRDDQKPNTPRSKHSATEQRRRSKINDRFQMLRELIPHGDQKRDKASFLLEVIEYIQYLQEKVHKYEGSYEGWNQEPPKFTPWKKSHMPAEGFVDKSRTTNTGFGQPLTFAAKYEENNANGTSPTNPRNGQNAIECDMRNVTPLRANDRNSGLTIKAVPLLVPLQPNIFTPSGNSNTIPPIQARVAGDMENVISQPQPQLWQGRSRATNCAVVSNKLKEQEFTIESGKISISSVYSQGLLNTLTQALQSSGIDLSQASISVQIDLGKRANSTMTASTSPVKDIDIQPSNPTTACSRGASSGEKSEQALKRLRTN